MKTKDDVLRIWNDYIDTYKHIKDNIGKWLDEKHPLPFNELWDVFGDTTDDEIRGHYLLWVRYKRNRLFDIADKNRLCVNISDDYYQIELRELTHGISLDEFVSTMGVWCVRGELNSHLPKGVDVDKIDFEEILDEKFKAVDYDELYKSITESIDMLHYRLQDEAIENTVKEIDELVVGWTDDCAKFVEPAYKWKFDEAIRLIQDLKDDSDYAEGAALVYNFLADGDFNSWYYGGIHGRGNSILNIVGYVEALKNRERLD